MRYISTRGGVEPVEFRDAILMGLGRDGGLLLPESIPDVRDQLADWSTLSYVDLATAVMAPFVDLPKKELQRLVEHSYSQFAHAEITPLVPVGDVWVQELFHGPTLAFKDLALQFLGNLFEYLLEGEPLNIVAATSGDTGSAAIHGVRGKAGIQIFVMHPHGRVSESQRLQMTTVLDDNVHNLAIEGTFDDCQELLKRVFSDLAFKDRHHLGAVNSINWARVLAQIVYYFYGAFRVKEQTGAKQVRFAVPTGNFGDIFAGYLAMQMGLPISKLVLATNENDILARFFSTGIYRRGDVHATLSPSMDIQVASNFERYLYYRLGADGAKVAALMQQFDTHGSLQVDGCDDAIVAGVGTRDNTLTTIRELEREHGYLVDPHTAVGVHVAHQHVSSDEPMICLATAHPAKFSAAILEATGRDLGHHPGLDALAGLPTRLEVLPASIEPLKAVIQAATGES
ncbi:MAG: threonine synthase [Verrucomicrobia bacterium]|nr:threonine synthase [Verrucomicrobiota bacterium]